MGAQPCGRGVDLESALKFSLGDDRKLQTQDIAFFLDHYLAVAFSPVSALGFLQEIEHK